MQERGVDYDNPGISSDEDPGAALFRQRHGSLGDAHGAFGMDEAQALQHGAAGSGDGGLPFDVAIILREETSAARSSRRASLGHTGLIDALLRAGFEVARLDLQLLRPMSEEDGAAPANSVNAATQNPVTVKEERFTPSAMSASADMNEPRLATPQAANDAASNVDDLHERRAMPRRQGSARLHTCGNSSRRVSQLMRRGSLLNVRLMRQRSGATRPLLLIRAPARRLVVQANAVKLRQWLDGTVLRELKADTESSAAAYTPARRLWLLHDMLSHMDMDLGDDASGAANAELHEQSVWSHPLVEEVFPLHDKQANRELLRLMWSRGTPSHDSAAARPHLSDSSAKDAGSSAVSDLPLDFRVWFRRRGVVLLPTAQLTRIRNHYGDEVGFYFAWCSYYIQWLAWLAPLGCLVGIAENVLPTAEYRRLQTFWALAVVLWASLYSAFWRRRTHSLRVLWELGGTEVMETRREFKPMKRRCMDHSMERQSLSRTRARKQKISAKLEDTDMQGSANDGIDDDDVVRLSLSVAAQMSGAKSANSGDQFDDIQRQSLNYIERQSLAEIAGGNTFTRATPSAIAQQKAQNKYYPAWRRAAVAFGVVPFLLGVMVVLFVLILLLFNFEMWIIFEWGGCRDTNRQLVQAGEDPDCIGAPDNRGFAGWLLELMPGVLEALIFEALLALFHSVTNFLVNRQNWRLQQHHDSAYAFTLFSMESVGMFTWYFAMAFYFVPSYGDESELPQCQLGSNETAQSGVSFDVSCIKAHVAYPTRLLMMRNYMVMPFLMNQLINMVLATFLPRAVHQHQIRAERTRGDSGTQSCGLGSCLCALLSRILCHKALTPLQDFDRYSFDSDTGAASVTDDCNSGPKSEAEANGHGGFPRGKLVGCNLDRKQVQSIVGQSSLFNFTAFNEYAVVLLNFAWVCFFSVVFPWGPAAAMATQLIEIRADAFKLSKVCQRPFPRRATSIGPWQTIMDICMYASVFVNMALLILPLDVLTFWGARAAEGPTDTVQKGTLHSASDTAPSVIHWERAVLFVLLFERAALLLTGLVHKLVPKHGKAYRKYIAARNTALRRQMAQILSRGTK